MKPFLAVISIFAMAEAAFAEDAPKPKAAMSMAQSRDLYMAPPQGWITTRDNTAFVTFQGQVAQGFFNKMPSSSIIKDPSATCTPTGTVKMSGGMVCTHIPAVGKNKTAFYECEMRLDLQAGTLLPPGDECGEDGEFLQEERKKAARNKYWINWNDSEK